MSCLFVCVCRFVGYPGNYNTLFGVRNEDVSPSHCDDDDDEGYK